MNTDTLSIKEKAVYEYLIYKSKPMLCLHIGVAVGKQHPKNAVKWCLSILKSLCDMGKVKREEVDNKIYYSLFKTYREQVEEKNEIKEFKSNILHAISRKNAPKKVVKTEKKQTLKEQIKEYKEQIKVKKNKPKETNTPNQTSVKPIVVTKRKSMLLAIDDKEVRNKAVRLVVDLVIKKDKTKTMMKRELKKHVTDQIKHLFTEKQLSGNVVQSYIRLVVHESLTGKKMEYKTDGRKFKVGQKVLYKSKQGEKEGIIKRIFFDSTRFQRAVDILPNGENKNERKVDRGIIKIID